MADQKRYTVLGSGERYVSPAEKKKPGPPTTPDARPLDEARALLTPKMTGVLQAVQHMPADRRLEEVVVELRLGERFLAKSYTPNDLLRATGLTIRGTGTWVQLQPAPSRKSREAEDDAQPRSSRALYVSGPLESLARLHRAVSRGLTKGTDADLVKLDDIRLPVAADRLRGTFDVHEKRTAVEIVLFDWHDLLLKQAVNRVVALLEQFKVKREKVRVKAYDRGPTFIAAVTKPDAMAALGEYNFLRAARPLARVSLTKTVTRHAYPAARAPITAPQPTAQIAIFDGGYAGGHPLLDPYVHAVDLTPRPPIPDGLDHGTMVASAVVFGPFPTNGSVPAPSCRALAFRVLPDPDGDDDLELYGAIDAIEKQVPKLPEAVKVVNLSFGPRGPIDDLPSRFTYAIDRLARTQGVLFVTAVGNDGALPGHERIQAPADAVNNLAVGAYRLSAANEPEYAWYSCQGPGRPGGVTKPDLVAFGGCDKRPFYALVPAPGLLGDPSGTSFAAPLVASLAGRLAAEVDTQLTPEAMRALLIHSAQPVEPYPPSHVGHGRVPSTVEEVLACTDKRVSVLYQGTITPRNGSKMPFLLPTDFDPGGTVHFDWVVVYTPEIDEASPDEYTLAGIELAFRPHADVYSYSPPKGLKAASKALNIHQQVAECRALERAGWKRSVLPAAETSTRKTERELRAQDRKWETVVPGGKSKRPDGASEPMLTIHVVGRGAWDRPDPTLKARYAAVLTVTAPKYKGDLYADVLKAFDQLRPLALRQQGQVRRLRT
jgi:hypothetical protein